MQGLASITVDVLADFARATDSRKHDHLMFRDIQLFEGILDRGMDEEVTTTRTSLDFR